MATNRKAKPEWKAIKAQTAHGAYASIVLYEIEHGKDDYAIWGLSFGTNSGSALFNEKTRIHRSKIYYTRGGDAYFMNNGRRERLDAFMPRGRF